MTLKIKKTLSKSFAKLFQASVALIGSQNRESIGNSLFIHCTLVKKQGTGLGGDISISKVVWATGRWIHSTHVALNRPMNSNINIYN